ncbi:MAG TPA: DUF1697 domain-containing protein [Chloroflexota bacterium]
MTTYIALLRAINVGGHQKVAMTQLREFLVELGFADVRSLLQTGNLLFRSDTTAGSELERRLEAEAAKRLGLRTDFLIRTADEWRRVIERNPFADVAERNPSHLVVTFLKEVPDERSVDALRAAVTGPESIAADGNHLYISYPHGIGRSRLTNALIEAKLGTRGTGRNWNTILKLGTLIEA